MSEMRQIERGSHFFQWLTDFPWRDRRIWMLALLVYASIYFVYRQLNQPPEAKEETDVELGCFSPDNRFLALKYYHTPESFLVLLDLHTGSISKIDSPDPDEWWSLGNFSPSGKYLALTVHKKSENARWSQVGLYNISTKKIKILTHSRSFKMKPSFSPDEKRLIYSQANRERTSGQTRFADWDIYELDIDSGHDRQLTNEKFFLISGPFYLPDGKDFIFSGEGPHHFSSKVGISAYAAYEKNKTFDAVYKKKYQENTIFIFGQNNNELRPVLTNGPYTYSPRITRDGKSISYLARSDEMNRAAGETTYGFTYDIFLFENGRHHRLTNLRKSFRSYTMSPDGSLIAYTSVPEGKGEIQLWLLDVAKNQTKRIEITIESLLNSRSNTN